MLNQSINLYDERFQEKKVPLPINQMLMVLVASVLVLIILSYWFDEQYRQALQQNGQYITQKQQATQQLELAKKKLEKILSSDHVDSQINQVSRDINVRKQMIDFVSNNQFGSGEGFSTNLFGLASINVDNVWLDEISLADNFVKLSGSALKAEKVPEYFNAFRDERLFNGQAFDIFELQRDQSRDWKVDFVIASKAAFNE